MPVEPQLPSTKPYLVRALHEWCTDHGFTPYLTVAVDEHTVVPREYVKDGEITLNVSYDATGKFRIDNDTVAFTARFNGVAREINVPIGRVVAIYARENGVGMGFPAEDATGQPTNVASVDEKASAQSNVPVEAPEAPEAPKPASKRPSHLQRVK